jgi:hypothetical protein
VSPLLLRWSTTDQCPWQRGIPLTEQSSNRYFPRIRLSYQYFHWRFKQILRQYRRVCTVLYSMHMLSSTSDHAHIHQGIAPRSPFTPYITPSSPAACQLLPKLVLDTSHHRRVRIQTRHHVQHISQRPRVNVKVLERFIALGRRIGRDQGGRVCT